MECQGEKREGRGGWKEEGKEEGEGATCRCDLSVPLPNFFKGKQLKRLASQREKDREEQRD